MDKLFSYKIAAGQQLVPGGRVLVPFRGRVLTGVVVAFQQQAPSGFKLATVIKPLDQTPLLSEGLLQLGSWIAAYYAAPLGVVLDAMLPGGLAVKSKTTYQFIQMNEQNGIFPVTALPEAVFWEDVADQAWSKHRLKQQLGLSDYKIRKWKQQGWLQETLTLLPPRVREKQQLVFTPAVSSEKLQLFAEAREQKAPLQAAALQALRGGVQPRDQVSGIPLAVFRRLEKEGLLTITEEQVFRNPFKGKAVSESGTPPALFPQQEQAVQAIVQAINQKIYKTFVLHGITGSGKTEVYLRSAETAVKQGGQVLIMVPEIALTPQLYSRFQARFPGKTALLHSALSAGERLDEWSRVRSGDARVVIGTRSALFAPFTALRLIVVDEEHDHSFKQENQPSYSGRDVAVVRGMLTKCPVVLGSATPSLETFRNVETGKYTCLSLPQRIFGRALPAIQCIDMRIAAPSDPGRILSQALLQAMDSTLAKGEQVLLLLNRRGYNSSLLCQECGDVYECPFCTVSLTYHKPIGLMVCHYCGTSQELPTSCRACGSGALHPLGCGTEQLEELIREKFPAKTILRMDRDTVTTNDQHWQMYRKLQQNQVDILIGTQMIAKGWDLPGVTLVGILSADNGLFQPDFRAAERTFVLLTQAAGRAGRGNLPGIVMVQTYNPDHYALKAAVKHDYQQFYQEETAFRSALGYPPWGRLVNIKIRDEDRDAGYCLARDIAEELGELSHNQFEVIGPSQAPLAKIAGSYRWQVLLKGEDRKQMNKALQKSTLVADSQRVLVDIDPLNLL